MDQLLKSKELPKLKQNEVDNRNEKHPKKRIQAKWFHW
jgi:hypothetical protein